MLNIARVIGYIAKENSVHLDVAFRVQSPALACPADVHHAAPAPGVVNLMLLHTGLYTSSVRLESTHDLGTQAMLTKNILPAV